jgi:hypothetical protein
MSGVGRNIVSRLAALVLCASFVRPAPAAAQDRPLLPAEGLVLGIDYVITPMEADLGRSCTCVASAFSTRRLPYENWMTGPGHPLRHVDQALAIRLALDRQARDHGVIEVEAPETGPNGVGAGRDLLVTGRGFGAVQGPAAVRLGVERHMRAAYAGQGDAQADLAYLHMIGFAVPQSDSIAAYWYYQAALNGSGLAKLALGAMYALGRGVEQSEAGAVYWFHQGRQRHFVADAYACGFGLPLDLDAARALYEDLAAEGDAHAQFKLAYMHAEACGAPRDDAKAAKWYEEAAQVGHLEAQIALSHMYRQGLGVPMNGWAAYLWAEVALLRLGPESALRSDALAARDAAARMASAEEREGGGEIARGFVEGQLESARRQLEVEPQRK